MKEAEAECGNTGEISPETRRQILGNPRLRFWWSEEHVIDITLKEKEREIASGIAKARTISVCEARALLRKDRESLPEYKRFRTQEILRVVRERELRDWSDGRTLEIQSDYGLQRIPDGYHLDKIIRYGNWVERDLDRAYDRLEQVQRRRKAKGLLASPVNVRLTQ